MFSRLDRIAGCDIKRSWNDL